MLNKVKITHSARVAPSPTLPAWGLFRWVWTPGLWPTPTPEGAAACVCWPVSRLGPGRTGRKPVTRQGSRPAGPRWWWLPNCDLRRRRRTTWLTGRQSSSVTGRMLFIRASWTCLLVSSEVCCTRFKHRNGSRKQHEKLLWWRTTSVLSFIIQCSQDNILKPCPKL